MIAMLVGWFLMLIGVIFFFAGGGGSIITAFVSGRLSSVLRDPRYIFSATGFVLWLAGAVMMLAGWIGAQKRRKNCRE
jgi:hypothetical protein